MPEALNAQSQAVAFESYMKKEIEKIIQEEDGVLSNENVVIRIANISFAFDNCELISKLKTRGGFITNGKFDKLAAIDQQIDTIRANQYDKLSQPVAAFITFET